MAQRSTGLRMWCLGEFRCETGKAEPFDFGTQKARALLVYLAVETPRSFRRSHLAGLLWSEYSEKNARHNLRQTLLRVSKGWPKNAHQPPLLLKNKDTVALNPEVDLWVDLLAFETAVERALGSYSDRKRLEKLDIHSLIAAMNLFTGPFLERFRLFDSLLFNEWAALVRERTTKKALEVHTLLCKYYERRGDYPRAAHLAERITALAPWDNSACAHSMRLYALQKQWTTAKRQYEQFQTYLKHNLDLAPNPAVTGLYEEIRTLSNQEGNLPPLTPVIEDQIPDLPTTFIGRNNEISQLSRRLADPENRLITLVARGGMGKTRLALAVGHLLRGLYAHGVFFVPLRDVSSLEGLDRLIGECMGQSFTGTTSHRRQLIDFLRKKQCLLILDGCEHHQLNDPIRSLIAEILKHGRDVKLLATARERLNLPEEQVFPLTGLDFQLKEPFEEDLGHSRSEAVVLFETRAQQVNPGFSLTPTTLPLVDGLCRKVGGHPLSIELMSAAMATLSIPALIEDLNATQLAFDPAHLALPTEGHSLAIVLEHSWQFLSEAQRDSLCRLTCFKGGFTQAAALQVAQTTPALFTSLVDRSFLTPVSANRWTLHEIIHDFARQKAIHRGLLNPTQAVHAAYFRALLAAIAVENQPIIRANALDQIEAELENILAAWAYFIEKNQIQKLDNCIDILFQFFNIRSLFQEGAHLFQQTLHSANYLAPFDPLLGMLANRLGVLAQRMRQNAMALQMFTQARAVFEGQQESIELGLAYLGLGNYHMRVKAFEEALSYTQQAQACFRNLGDRTHEGRAHYLMGMIHQRSGDYATAKPFMATALEISREIGDQRGMIARLNQLAGHDCNQGDFATAEDRYLESLMLSREFKDRYQQAMILNNLASVYHPRGEYEQEQSVLEESLAICREIGDQDGEAIALTNLGELAIVLGQHQQALKYCRAALDIALRLGEHWTIIAVYDILGCTYLGFGEHTTADQCLRQAIKIAYQIQSWDLLTRSVVNLAEVHLAQKQVAMARELLKAALCHPSILYEYGLKAADLLAEIGDAPPETKDAGVLLEVLQTHLVPIPPKA
jgi:predicted ATPase/DNA-binding SARP family transcriptional activator